MMRKSQLHDTIAGHVKRGEVPGIVTLVTLGIKDTGFSVPPKMLDRLASCYQPMS